MEAEEIKKKVEEQLAASLEKYGWEGAVTHDVVLTHDVVHAEVARRFADIIKGILSEYTLSELMEIVKIYDKEREEKVRKMSESFLDALGRRLECDDDDEKDEKPIQ